MWTGKMRRHFDRQFFADLIVLWFAVWIAWWFRRWLGHGSASLPDPGSPGAVAFYNLAMRTLARSLLQSFLIACAALAAWRLLHYGGAERKPPFGARKQARTCARGGKPLKFR
jgi:hypothetical protein